MFLLLTKKLSVVEFQCRRKNSFSFNGVSLVILTMPQHKQTFVSFCLIWCSLFVFFFVLFICCLVIFIFIFVVLWDILCDSFCVLIIVLHFLRERGRQNKNFVEREVGRIWKELGKQKNHEQNRFYDVDWLLPPALCQHCTSIPYRQNTIVDQRFCSCGSIYISSLVTCRVPSGTKNTSLQGLRLQVGTSLTSFSSMGCADVFCNRVLLSVCRQQPIALATAQIV